ncbi:hypothetical protein FACS1894217_15910 [Clostridia bacterium]|nr:hypothetical protein FACS1894217_15910 [Clostridia bacterium]
MAETLRNNETNLGERQKALLALQTSIGSYNKLLKALSETQSAYQEKGETSRSKRDEYESRNKAYLDEQAGVLAQTLAPSEPCPVYGSSEHPMPAVLSGGAPTKIAASLLECREIGRR